MLVPQLIERKRDGGALDPAQWRALLDAYTAGRVPDYQMAALLMAVMLNGLESGELPALTDALRRSGARLTLPPAGRPAVDTHATGGVGDKVALVLAPLVASLGVAVPMIGPRATGHAGGTVDKLEAIPGFRTALAPAEALRQLERLGCVMLGAGAQVAPADGKLQALRHVTGTVECLPLIAASMLARVPDGALAGVVFDVKRGSGALLSDDEECMALAQTLVRLSSDEGHPAVALLTAMDRPLGHACGNALEVEEAIAALHGEGPADLMDVTYALAVEVLLLAGVAPNRAAARADAERAIGNGKAAAVFAGVIEAQGGNPRVVDDPAALPQAPMESVVEAPRAGVVNRVLPRTIGRAVAEMGGTRTTLDGAIDHAVGIVLTVKPGDDVHAGQPVATVYARDAAGLDVGRAAVGEAVQIFAEMGDAPLPLVSHRVTGQGVELIE